MSPAMTFLLMNPPNDAAAKKELESLLEEPMAGPSGQTRPTTNTSKTSDDLSSRGVEEALNEQHHQSPVQNDKPIRL